MSRESPHENAWLPCRPSVVATVHQASDWKALEAPSPSSRDCDFLELRLDSLEIPADGSLPTRIAALPVPAIITARHPEEGGCRPLDDQERASLLLAHLPAAAAVDIELRSRLPLESVIQAARSAGAGLILSFHDFVKTPPAKVLRAAIDEAVDAGADVVKIATHLAGVDDLSLLLRILETESRLPVSAMGMGEFGRISRLLLAKCGSALNYGYLTKPNAPGQWAASELTRLLRAL